MRTINKHKIYEALRLGDPLLVYQLRIILTFYNSIGIHTQRRFQSEDLTIKAYFKYIVVLL
jgi:hypothetical protein